MPKKKAAISEAELEVMKVLWKSGQPITAQDVCDKLVNKEWKYSTIATLLGRMVDKGAVTHEKRGKFYYYTPLIDEQEYKLDQTKDLIGRLYDGSVKNLVVSLFANQEMSDQEVQEIKEMFDL